MHLGYLLGPILIALSGWSSVTFHSWNVTGDVAYLELCSQLFLFSLLYLISIWLLRGNGGSRILWVFLLSALASRAIFVFTPVMLTGDMPRYLWEGMLVREGLNPYLVAPNAESLATLRTEFWENIEYPHLSAIYPPVSQYLLALFGRSVLVWKFFLWFVELASVGLIALILLRKKLPLGRLVYYLALPVSLLEICGSGHLEGVLVLFLLLFIWYSMESAADVKTLPKVLTLGLLSFSMALGFLTKYVLALPFVFFAIEELRKRRWAFVSSLAVVSLVICLALFLPFLKDGLWPPFRSLSTYVSHWRYNDSLLHLLGIASGANFSRLETFAYLKVLLLGAWLCGSLWGIAADFDYIKLSIFSFCLFFLCSAVVHPWYVLWYAPLLCFAPLRSGLWLAIAAPFSYLSLFHPSGQVPVWVKVLEYLPLIVLLSMELLSVLRGTKGGELSECYEQRNRVFRP